MFIYRYAAVHIVCQFTATNPDTILQPVPELRTCICGGLNRPHYGSCTSVRQTVCPSVYLSVLYGLLTQKSVEKNNWLESSPGEEYRVANFQFKFERTKGKVTITFAQL